MAIRDDGHVVSLLKYGIESGATSETWFFNGNCKAHLLKITGIAFVSYKKN